MHTGSSPVCCTRPTRQIGNLRGRKPLYSSLPTIENSLKYARAGATHIKIKVPRMFFGIRTQPTQSASVMGQSLLSLRQESLRTRDGNAQKSGKPTRQCEAIRCSCDKEMPNAVAGNLQCLAVQQCTLGRKEVSKLKPLSQRRQQAYVGELLTHPCVGRVEVSQEVSSLRFHLAIHPSLREDNWPCGRVLKRHTKKLSSPQNGATNPRVVKYRWRHPQ